MYLWAKKRSKTFFFEFLGFQYNDFRMQPDSHTIR